jgi:hypothetical protein
LGFCTLLLLFTVANVHAQAEPSPAGLWLGYTLRKPVGKKFSWNTDLQLRFSNQNAFYDYTLIRTGLQYELNEHFSTSAGLLYGQDNYKGKSLPAWKNEKRLWQECRYFFGKLTALQALYAIYDNCNSLHTNAYDEAITTPTEESVRRAMAIQLIINRELGTAKNENPNQGSFLIEEMTDLVEQAVLTEFNRITERGGVLGAMERMYQRNKIQEESLYYETLKHTGEYPIVGVNTFLSKNGSPTILPTEVIRSTTEEKEFQITTLQAFHNRHAGQSAEMLTRLQQVAKTNGNLFEELMETVKYCSLGEITHALYSVGGQYRRNM